MAKAHRDVTLHFAARNGADLALKGVSPSGEFIVIARFPTEDQASAATTLAIDGIGLPQFVSDCGVKNEFVLIEGMLYAVSFKMNHADSPCLVFLAEAPADPRSWLQQSFLSESSSRWIDLPTMSIPHTLTIKGKSLVPPAPPPVAKPLDLPRLKTGQVTDWVEDADGNVVDGREAFLFWLMRQVLAGSKELFPVIDGVVCSPAGKARDTLLSLIFTAFKQRVAMDGKWNDGFLKSQIQERYPRVLKGFLEGTSKFHADGPRKGRGLETSLETPGKYRLPPDLSGTPPRTIPIKNAVPADTRAKGSPIQTWEQIEGAVAGWPTLEKCVCVVTNKEHNGRRYFDVRRWYKDADGTLKPGRQGITLSGSELPQLILALGNCKG